MVRFLSNRESILSVTGVAVGAGLMYLLDSVSGSRRRALLRDRWIHVARVGTTGAFRAKRDLNNRVHGLGLRVRAKTRPDEQVSDEVLAARIRSEMGVFVSHPRAVEVRVASGVVMLHGPILQREAKAFVPRVQRMAGVRQLEDRLERHPSPGRVPALQGGVVRRRRAEILQRHWTPGVQFLAGTAGIALSPPESPSAIDRSQLWAGRCCCALG